MEPEQRFQNIQILNSNVQKYGCFYIDLVNIYQDVAKHQVPYETINAVYVMSTRIKNFEGHPYMSKHCFVWDAPGVSQILSGITNIPVFIKVVNPYDEYNYTLGEFERVTRSGVVVDHFVELALNSNTVKRDPWQGGSRTAREGILKSKRFIIARYL